MLRFWSSKIPFWRKSRTKASFLSFKASFSKEVSRKCFVLELRRFIFEGSLAELLRFWSSKLHFWRKSRTKASFLSFKAWSLAERLWISNRLTTKSLESQINWPPTHLNLKTFEIQIRWLSHQLTTKIIWITHQLTTNSLESQINWQPPQLKFNSTDNQNHFKHTSIDTQNRLNLRSDDNQIIWLSTRLNLTSIDFRTSWTPHTPFL